MRADEDQGDDLALALALCFRRTPRSALSSMAAAPQAPPAAPPQLDTAQFATLFPSLVRLSHLASSSSSSPAPDPAHPPADPDAHRLDPKLELSRQAAALHATLQALDAQVALVPNAHLSVDDQQWLVHQLELECTCRRCVLFLSLSSARRAPS